MYEILFGKSMLLTALEHKLRAAYSKGRGSVNTSGLEKREGPLSKARSLALLFPVMQMREGRRRTELDFIQQHCHSGEIVEDIWENHVAFYV